MQAIKKILCPVDFSPASGDAFEYARSLARILQADLELLHVVPGVNETYTALFPDFPSSGVYNADDAVTDFDSFLGESAADFKKTVRMGPVSFEINTYAAEMGADLVVIGARGHSTFERIFIGATGEEVARRSECPVLTVRGGRRPPVQRIIVPVDYSPLCYSVLPIVAVLAEAFDAEVDFLHVIEAGHKENRHADADEYFEIIENKLMEQWETPQSFEHIETQKWIRRHSGSAGYGILQFAQERTGDLIVMATHGRSGLSKVLLGNVTEKVLRISDIPLLSQRSKAT